MKPIELEEVYPASPAEVYDALTNPEMLLEWAGDDAVLETRPGGKVALFEGWVSGEVLAAEPHRRLQHTWVPNTWDEPVTRSVVTYTLSPHDEGCLLVLRHEGFPNEEERNSHEEGWGDFVFEPLHDLLG